MVNLATMPSRKDENAIHPPSGDQDGRESPIEPLVRQVMLRLDVRSLSNYTMMVSSILYFHRNTTGAALISSKYW